MDRARRVLLASDFDGTLAEIAPHPQDAIPVAGAVSALSVLARRPGWTVALVSGRTLADLRQLCPVPGARYFGSYGNESERENGFEFNQLESREQIAGVTATLRPQMSEWPGTHLEAKQYSVALHYRNAPQWEAAIREYASVTSAEHDLKVQFGRRVVELLPREAATKADTIVSLFNEVQCDLGLYFGDDASDEDVFQACRAIRGEALIGVKVEHGEEGGRDTVASFRLAGPSEVAATLRMLIS